MKSVLISIKPKYCELIASGKKTVEIRKNRSMSKEQLCWTCQRACGGCPWSRSLTPVEGWTVTPSSIKTTGREEPTYHIEECPLYIADKGMIIKPKQRKGKKHLTAAEKKMIADLYKNGIKRKDIAKELKISYDTVKKYSQF